MQAFPRKTDLKLVVVRWYPTKKTQYELFHEGVKPALGKTIRGKKTITRGNTIWLISGFLDSPNSCIVPRCTNRIKPIHCHSTCTAFRCSGRLQHGSHSASNSQEHSGFQLERCSVWRMYPVGLQSYQMWEPFLACVVLLIYYFLLLRLARTWTF